MQRRIVAIILCLGSGPALGAEPEVFTGETAAVIDWSVKSCEFKSSDKTRKLVEEEKAKSEARFADSYMKGFSSKLIAEANGKREATEKLCAKIKEWYGNSGSRIAGLVAGPKEAIEPGTSAKKESPAGGRGRHKRAQ